MTEPLVTVLLPAYNAGPYLRESIDSVLAQTFTDFELLVINDGSKDDTADILATYTDPRMTVVHQQNMGLIKTLNKGLQLAKGKWIARFDADDVCYPERLQVQVDFLKNNPDHVLTGGEADYMDEDGNFIFTFHFRNYDDAAIRADNFRLCPVIHAAVMFHKDAVIAAGGYDDHAITFEDHLLWRNLAKQGKMMNMHKPLIKVRFNAASVTIDEKWRGQEFIDLKMRSIQQGFVTLEDFELLKKILKAQDFAEYKKASYHAMLGKKYLWNNPDSKEARRHLRIAMGYYKKNFATYALYAFSYLPASFRQWIYKTFKK
jgi:glycosyltransferase involved in cell wall biosynthesis